MLTRRLFLGAALAAPAIVRSESLMKLWVPPERRVLFIDDCVIPDFMEMQPWKVWVGVQSQVIDNRWTQAEITRHMREAMDTLFLGAPQQAELPRLAVSAPDVRSFCASPHK